jgi:DHA2 family multidrug resistance protein-like MFS transporter
VVAAGLVLTAIGLGLLTQVADEALTLAVVASVILALGVAPVVTLGTDLIVGAAPPERAGAASGISETGAELGGALGIAVLGSIGVAVYRSQVTDAVPAGVPPEYAETAKDTLGGAVDAAEGLPDELGTALLDAAREAFTQGLQLAAVIGAVVMTVVAVAAAVLLRREGGGNDDEGHAAPANDEAIEAARTSRQRGKPERGIDDRLQRASSRNLGERAAGADRHCRQGRDTKGGRHDRAGSW